MFWRLSRKVDLSCDLTKLQRKPVPQDPSETADEKEMGQNEPVDKDSKKKEGAGDETVDSKEDPVSGTWTGTIETNRGSSDLTMVLQLDAKGKVTGSYETSRSGRRNHGCDIQQENRCFDFSR